MNEMAGMFAQYQVVVEQDKQGLFVARCPTLPDCVGQGTTPTLAIAKLKDVMPLHTLKSCPEQAEDAKCDVPDCESEATVYFARIESRRVALNKSLCERHGEPFFRDFRSSVTVGTGLQCTMLGATCVDVELICILYSSRRNTPSPACIYLSMRSAARGECVCSWTVGRGSP